ncbi:unnamed protein product [Prunus armeniaca]|uniref:Uncharacterized protein n=1 Tax=Prunus armeniaca TaxID=36596 RepID=A0A6J5VN58_PRUAR|nr:unnamed protein product [Prunus armeniaca]
MELDRFKKVLKASDVKRLVVTSAMLAMLPRADIQIGMSQSEFSTTRSARFTSSNYPADNGADTKSQFSSLEDGECLSMTGGLHLGTCSISGRRSTKFMELDIALHCTSQIFSLIFNNSSQVVKFQSGVVTHNRDLSCMVLLVWKEKQRKLLII